jgi:uncharacterized protein
MDNNENSQPLFKASIVLAIAIVLSAIIASKAVQQFAAKDQSIVVTGSARKRIKSDYIVWRVGIKSQAGALTDSYRSLAENIKSVKEYLINKGIVADQIVASSINTSQLTEKEPDGSDKGRVIGYLLAQTIEVRSREVEKITVISREITELINQGILLDSAAPEYHYTKLSDLKIAMLEEASKDAKLRAEQIATSTGSKIGKMSAARMGVFQITAADSNEVSGYGVNDTSSLEKDITAVVNINFNVD